MTDRHNALLNDFASFLLDIGFGLDFGTGDVLPPREVLDRMVEIAATDPDLRLNIVDREESLEERLEQAYYVLSDGLGDWRDSG